MNARRFHRLSERTKLRKDRGLSIGSTFFCILCILDDGSECMLAQDCRLMCVVSYISTGKGILQKLTSYLRSLHGERSSHIDIELLALPALFHVYMVSLSTGTERGLKPLPNSSEIHALPFSSVAFNCIAYK